VPFLAPVKRRITYTHTGQLRRKWNSDIISVRVTKGPWRTRPEGARLALWSPNCCSMTGDEGRPFRFEIVLSARTCLCPRDNAELVLMKPF